MAVADHFNAVQKLYIAYYQRPADPAGLKYWALRLDAANGDATEIIDSFANAAESRELYGEINESSIGKVIDAIYQVLFGRLPEEAGKAFFISEFAAGRLTEGNITLGILNGAQNADQVAIANKLAVANVFSALVDGRPLTDPAFGNGAEFAMPYAGKEDADSARELLSKVTADPTSVLSPESITDYLIGDINDGTAPITRPPVSTTYVLTTGVDNIVGSSGKDMIFGVADSHNGAEGSSHSVTQTFGGLDAIDGGAGNDTLILTNEVGTMNLATSVDVKNVEELVLRSMQNDVTADVQKWVGLDKVSVDQRGAADDIRITTKANVTTVDIKAGALAAAHDSDGAGTADEASSTIRIHDANSGSGDKLSSVSVAGAKGPIVVESDALQHLSLADSATVAKVVNATEGHTLNLSLSNVQNATVVDATAGKISVTATSASTVATKAQSVKLNAATAQTIELNAQSDLTVTLSNQADGLNVVSKGGSALDLRTVLDNDVSFAGGAGNETVRIDNTNTKAVSMGAGDDVVYVFGTTLGAGGTIDGGEGTDTLVMSADDAAALSSLAQADAYESRISSFEKVSLGHVSGGQSSTINMDNLDGIKYVVSAGTAEATGVAEQQVVEFNAAGPSGGTFTAGGIAITVPENATALEVALAVIERQEAIKAANPNIAELSVTPAGLLHVIYTSTSGDHPPFELAGNPSGVHFSGLTAENGAAARGEVQHIGVYTSPVSDGEILVAGVPVALTKGQDIFEVAKAIRTALDAAQLDGVTAVTTFSNSASISFSDSLGDVPPVVIEDPDGIFGGGVPPGVLDDFDIYLPAFAETQQFTLIQGTDADGGEILVGGVRIALAGNMDINAVGASIVAQEAAIIEADPNIVSLTYNTADQTVTITYSDAAGDVPGIALADNDASSLIESVSEEVKGVPGSDAGVLTLDNLAVGGTFELVNENQGETNLKFKDASGSDDAFTIKLNGEKNLDAGRITMEGIEQLTIITTDSLSDDTQIRNPMDAAMMGLVAQDVTSLTITGNHGISLGHESQLGNLTSLDATGVVPNVNTEHLTAEVAEQANGWAGGINFYSNVTDQDVTVKTGGGYDYIDVSSVGTTDNGESSASVFTGAGNDLVVGGAGNDIINLGAGKDKVISSAGADEITLGSGNDTYVLLRADHSMVSSHDTITDFESNTRGYGVGKEHLGSYSADRDDAAAGDGDTIDITGVLDPDVKGIKVFVASGAAEAHTFIQSLADSTDADMANLTGIAMDASTGMVYMDFNRDGLVDSVLELQGVATLTETAFYTGLGVDPI
jgi:hypothetical protein